MVLKHNCTLHLSHHPSGKRYLPQPRGPHSVGFFDLMTPGNPQSSSLLRVFYPTDEQCLEQHARWPEWIDDKYSAGILSFMKAMAHRWPSWAQHGEYLHLDVVKHAFHFIPSFGFPHMFRLVLGDVHIPVIRNAKLMKNEQGWPVIIFSHGMGCARFTYSQICYDLASHGFVVASAEHRDGSGCLSFYNESTKREWVPHRRIDHSEDEYQVRNSQVHQRASDVRRALDVMTAINNGSYVENLLTPNEVGSEMDLSHLKGCLQLDSAALCGHSFGGATTLLALSQDERFRVGIVLDGWMFPIRDEEISSTVKQPILFVNSESFRHVDNLKKMSTFSDYAGVDRDCCYIKGSLHQNHLDTPFIIEKSLLKKVFGVHSETCPETVMDITSKLSIRFLHKWLHLPHEAEIDVEITKHKDFIVEGFEG